MSDLSQRDGEGARAMTPEQTAAEAQADARRWQARAEADSISASAASAHSGKLQTENARLRALLQRALALIADVEADHRHWESAIYYKCEISPCLWCKEAAEIRAAVLEER